jgi:hypothetical protein
MTLPTEEQVKKRVTELLNAKDYSTAAQVMVYYTFCKIDPEQLAARLFAKVQEFINERKVASGA